MDENAEPRQEQPEIVAVPAPIPPNPENPPPAQLATEEELRATEKTIENQIDARMTAFERSMIRLTRYGLTVTILTGFIFAGQLYEMITGSTATDKLVNYASTQAQSAKTQEQWGLEPYVDLTRATLLASPLDTDKPVAVVTFVNEGKVPAKNVRIEAFLELHAKGAPLKPRRKECLPKWGSTYPSESPQIIIKQMKDGMSPAQITAYRGGEDRLYLYGSVKYQDFWRQDRPGEKPPADQFRSSIFCRSFGRENEEFLRIKHPPEGAAIMGPCTAEEWPFDDHHEPESSYAGCSQEEGKNPN